MSQWKWSRINHSWKIFEGDNPQGITQGFNPNLLTIEPNMEEERGALSLEAMPPLAD
jgi:hypothetical protein